MIILSFLPSTKSFRAYYTVHFHYITRPYSYTGDIVRESSSSGTKQHPKSKKGNTCLPRKVTYWVKQCWVGEWNDCYYFIRTKLVISVTICQHRLLIITWPKCFGLNWLTGDANKKRFPLTSTRDSSVLFKGTCKNISSIVNNK